MKDRVVSEPTGDRFRALFESAPDAVVIVDGHGKISLVNHQTEKLFGYRREDLLGQPVELLVPDGLREAHADHRAAYAADPQARPMGAGLELFAVRKDGKLAMGGDGQVTVGDTVMKQRAVKVRVLADGKVLAGFAGAAADAFTLFEKFEEKLQRFPDNLPRAAGELAKDWRSDRVLRRLEALLAVADAQHGFVISGSGELIEPDDGALAIGSGGNYALAAARGLLVHSRLSAKEVVERSLEIAADICVFTNRNITVLELG